jgi:hypothetical protein
MNRAKEDKKSSTEKNRFIICIAQANRKKGNEESRNSSFQLIQQAVAAPRFFFSPLYTRLIC